MTSEEANKSRKETRVHFVIESTHGSVAHNSWNTTHLLVDNELLSSITIVNCTAYFLPNQFGKWLGAIDDDLADDITNVMGACSVQPNTLAQEAKENCLGLKINVIWKNNVNFHPKFPTLRNM